MSLYIYKRSRFRQVENFLTVFFHLLDFFVYFKHPFYTWNVILQFTRVIKRIVLKNLVFLAGFILLSNCWLGKTLFCNRVTRVE